MKFEYETKQDDSGDQELVAVVREIDGEINVAIKTDEGCTFIYDSNETPNHGDHRDWEFEVKYSIHKFYHGDELKITF